MDFYFQVPVQLTTDRNLTLHERFLLIYLASLVMRANAGEKFIYFTADFIGLETGLDPIEVQQMLAKLELLGYIKLEKRPGYTPNLILFYVHISSIDYGRDFS